MTDSDLKRFNRRFAEDFGRTPLGEPRYKWIRTRDLFYLIEDDVDVRTPAGLYVTIDGYRKVTWEQRLGPGWFVAQWRAPGAPDEWRERYKTALPYPPNGMYFPIPGSHIQSEPTMEITMEAIRKIRDSLELNEWDVLAKDHAHAEREDRALRSETEDQIDNDWPAFNGEPVVQGFNPEKDTL